MGNIVSIEGRGWFTAEELAERNDVSTRTIYNRLKRGEVEKRETESGARYRLKSTERETFTEVHERPAENEPKASTSKGKLTTERPFHEPFTEATEGPFMKLVHRLETGAVERGRLEAERDRLAAELEEWQAFALEAVEAVERLRGY